MPCRLGMVKGRRAREVPWKASCSVMQYAYHAMSASPKYMADASFRRQLVGADRLWKDSRVTAMLSAMVGGPLRQNLDHPIPWPAPKQMQLLVHEVDESVTVSAERRFRSV